MPIGLTYWQPAPPIVAHGPTMPPPFRISSMDGDVFFDRHSNHIRVASNFVAGITEHVNYASKRLARIEEVPEIDPLFVERSPHFPAVTDDSPDLVYLSHGHSVGGRADAVIDVGFSPSGVAGYSSGDIGGVLGKYQHPIPAC